MNLSHAFKIQTGDCVAFVGGGGKSTAMFRLGRELSAAGKKVLLTTSTRIFAAQIALAPAAVAFNPETQSVADILPALKKAVAEHGQVLLTGHRDDTNAFGIPPDVIDALAQSGNFDVILNEADGSRRRSFKAPAAHEPVIPPGTTVVIPVAGMDVLAQPLTDEWVHRPQIISALADVPPACPITPEIIAAVLAHPQGGRKSAPPGARVVPLLNKVTAETEAAAVHTARLMLKTDGISAVALGAVADETAIRRVVNRVAAVVLAAGEGRRFGGGKQLAQWRGKPLVAHAADAALASAADGVTVVLGARADAVRGALPSTQLMVVENPSWANGMSSSLQAGLSALPKNIAAVVVLLADQPQVSAATINALIERFQRTLAPVVYPTFAGKRGNPVLLGRELFPQLRQLRGDAGARAVVSAHLPVAEAVAVPDAAILRDVDTPADLDALG